MSSRNFFQTLLYLLSFGSVSCRYSTVRRQLRLPDRLHPRGQSNLPLLYEQSRNSRFVSYYAWPHHAHLIYIRL